MQHFLGDPDLGKLHLETHRLALAIAKKTLDENRFTATQKTLARDNPAFQVGYHVYFKNKQPGKWDLKWRPRYQVVCIEHNGHFIHIENQATGKIQSCNVTDIILEPPIEFWNINTQFSRASHYINHPANLPTIHLTDISLVNFLQCTFFIFNITLNYHLHYSLVLTLTPTMNSSQTELGVGHFLTSTSGIPNQTLLDHYCTCIFRKFGACHWKLFTRQLTRTQQFLRSLDQHPSAPTQLLATLQLELSNIQDIYKSSETTITSAIQLLNSNQLQTRAQCRRGLLPFLGDALSWLTGTATTKDIHSIKTRINQLIATQTSQCNTLVHIVSILNITRYATQVNRHSINNLIDAVCTTSQDINKLYNLTTSLATSINFNQMILHIRSVFANL